MLYNLGAGEENLSFGDLRFEDSYNLAEPEPVLDPVILNFRPVGPVPVEVEPEMADPNADVDAILQVDPQPPLLVPDPGTKHRKGGK